MPMPGIQTAVMLPFKAKHTPIPEYTQNTDVKHKETPIPGIYTDQCNVTIQDKTYPNPGIHMKH